MRHIIACMGFLTLIGLSACSDNAGEGSALPPQLFLPELLIASATIPPSTAPIQFEQNLSRFSDQTFTYSFDGVEKSLNDFLKEAGVKHFLIVDDGEIVYEYRRFPFSVTSRHQSWSMAKQVLSILIGVAIDEGFIQSIEDPMDRYEPLLSQNGFAGISFRQALQMSSGIRYNEQKDRFKLFFDIIEDRATFGTSGSTLIEKTTEDTLVADYPPDSQWQYTSINSQALAMALTAATGRPLKEYLWEKLWNPLGIPDKARMLVDTEQAEFTFCCLYASARSYAAIGQLYANGGSFYGKQLVSPDWVRLSTTQDDPRSWTGEQGVKPEGTNSDNFGWAYHWWTLKGDRGDFTAMGVYGQAIHVFPNENTIIVRLSGDYEEGAHREESLALNRAIADYLN